MTTVKRDNSVDWSLGDFSGDGSTDVFRYVPGVSGADMFLGSGSALSQDGSWTDAWNGGRTWYVGDFDGDGKDDILRTLIGQSDADVFLSTGRNFVAAGSWLTTSDPVPPAWQIGDFNGDGRDDLLKYVPGRSGADVYLSTGNGFVFGGSWTAYGPGSGWHLGDFNGDGRTDLMRVLTGIAGAEVLLANGSAFEAGAVWTTLAPSDGWQVLDLDGDGKADLLDGSGRVLKSNGSGFTYVGDLPRSQDEKILGVAFPTDDDNVSLLIKGADTETISGIVTRSLDMASLHQPFEFLTGLAPRVAFAGKPVDLALGALPSGVEVRLIMRGTDLSIGEWTSNENMQFTPTSPGMYTLTFEYRDSSGDAIGETFGGRPMYVIPDGQQGIMSLNRISLGYYASDVSHLAAQEGWRDDVHSFDGLYRYVDSLFEQRALTGASGPEAEKAIFLLQFVSGLWAYGNLNNPSRPGEVTDNEVVGSVDPSDVTFGLFINSPIGGCEDFAAVLGILLTQAGIENRIVLNPSHVFNEAKIGDQWWTLDATFGLAIALPFDEALQQSSSPAAYLFEQEGRAPDSPIFRERLVEGVYEHLALIDQGVFPGASHYQTIDYVRIFPYHSVFTEVLDLSGWESAFPVPLIDSPQLAGLTLDEFLRSTSLDRLKISEGISDIAGIASGQQWRADISDFHGLRASIDAQFDRSTASTDPADEAWFYLQWVSGMWGYQPTDDSQSATVQDFLARTTASSEDRTALLGWLLTNAGIPNRIVLGDGGSFNEISLNGQAWVLDSTAGLAFKGDWNSLRDTSRETDVFSFVGAGRLGNSGIYDPRFSQSQQEMLIKVANGSLAAAEYQSTDNWLLTRSYGPDLIETIDRFNPILLSAVRGSDEGMTILPSRSLPFVVTFSEAVSHLDATDFRVTGTTASISSIVSSGGGRYTVQVSGGDLDQVKGMVSLTLRPDNNITDRAGNPVAFSASEEFAPSYIVGVDPTFHDSGVWTSAEATSWSVADFDGDGRDDIFRYLPGVSGADMFLSNGFSFASHGSWTDHWNGGQAWYVGDFNGDGKADIFRYMVGNSGADMFLSTGEGFVSVGSWTTAGYGSAGWFVGDFNGDGRDDIFRYVPGASGADMFLSTGNGFERAGNWTTAGYGDFGWTIGDFNGDGKDDILRKVSSGEADMFLSTGTGFSATGNWTQEDVRANRWLAGDVNGDGKDDIFWYVGDHVEARLSDGSHFESPDIVLTEPLTASRLWTGDFDGNGSIDLLGGLPGVSDTKAFLSDGWFV